MKILMEEKDEKELEKRGTPNADFVFEKRHEGKRLFIEVEITDYALASIFVTSFLSKNSDFFKAGVAPKEIHLNNPTREKINVNTENLSFYLNKALEEVKRIKEGK